MPSGQNKFIPYNYRAWLCESAGIWPFLPWFSLCKNAIPCRLAKPGTVKDILKLIAE
jgi:hypothetical protein